MFACGANVEMFVMFLLVSLLHVTDE